MDDFEQVLASHDPLPVIARIELCGATDLHHRLVSDPEHIKQFDSIHGSGIFWRPGVDRKDCGGHHRSLTGYGGCGALEGVVPCGP